MDEKLALPAAFKVYYQVLKRAHHAMRDHQNAATV
jgi:hypothetical protein